MQEVFSSFSPARSSGLPANRFIAFPMDSMVELIWVMADNRSASTLSYPASSWFLLRQTREKPLRATVCFSIEHARVRHAPSDAFDAFETFVQKNESFSPKVLAK